MIICSCRNISTNDFNSLKELKERLFKNDAECGTCQEDIELLFDEVDNIKQLVKEL